MFHQLSLYTRILDWFLLVPVEVVFLFPFSFVSKFTFIPPLLLHHFLLTLMTQTVLAPMVPSTAINVLVDDTQKSPTAKYTPLSEDDNLSRIVGPYTSGMVRDHLEHAKAHWKKEKILLKFNYKVLLLGVFFQYVHSVGTNVAYYLHQQREPLYDLGFATFPALSRQMQVLSEVMFFVLVGGTILFALSPFFNRTMKRKLYTTLMLSRFIGVCVLAQSLRVITFLATSLPGPNYHCRPGSTEYNPPRTAYDIFLRQDAFTGCGDLVFSSHTIFVLLCALTYTKYSDNVWGKRFMWFMVLIFGFMVVAARKHYSIDIVVAWYTVPLIWIAYDVFFPDRLPQVILDMESSSEANTAKDIV